MKNTTKLLLLVLIIALGFTLYFIMQKDKPAATFTQDNLMPATFTWETEPSNAVNLDGLPKTNVYVKATFENGVVERKLVDVESGCGELPSQEEDGAVFQCYAAGAGYKYKVVKGTDSYEVQRKAFEEALPNQDSKNFAYEVISEFSLPN